jgi:hypothetical protein
VYAGFDVLGGPLHDERRLVLVVEAKSDDAPHFSRLTAEMLSAETQHGTSRVSGAGAGSGTRSLLAQGGSAACESGSR